MTKQKPKFRRTDGHKYSKLGVRRKKKQIYRKSRGRDNKIRLNMKGHVRNVRVGFRTAVKERDLVKGMKQVMVYNIRDLEKIKEGMIGLVRKIGAKKKMEIAKVASEKKIKLMNLDAEKFLKEIEEKMEKTKEEKDKRDKKRKARDKKAKEKEKKDEKGKDKKLEEKVEGKESATLKSDDKDTKNNLVKDKAKMPVDSNKNIDKKDNKDKSKEDSK